MTAEFVKSLVKCDNHIMLIGTCREAAGTECDYIWRPDASQRAQHHHYEPPHATGLDVFLVRTCSTAVWHHEREDYSEVNTETFSRPW